MIILRNKSQVEEISKRVEKISEKFLKEGLLLSCDMILEREFRKLYKEREPTIVNLAKFNYLIYGKDASEIL
jgi:hypothetical protein